MINMIVAGNLGKDATVNDVNGKKAINFSIAHTEKWKDAQGQQQERTTWVECTKWAKSDVIAKYLKKGSSVVLSGIPSTKSYQSADGTPKATLCLTVQELQLMGGNSKQDPVVVTNEGVDDIPF